MCTSCSSPTCRQCSCGPSHCSYTWLQTQPYPPWRRLLTVWYDGPAKRARVDVHEGYDEGKSYIRRYDTKSEFLIKNGSFPQCRRAYLSACPPG